MSQSSAPPSQSPYRNEIDALQERKESLEREIARLKEQTTHLEGLRTRESDLERELTAVAQKIGASRAHQAAAAAASGNRRSLPMLDQVKVASPCSASWDEMLGDDRVRFCVSCEKNVYNLSAMPRQDAEQLLADRMGKELCVRFYQRADGTMMTQDCPVGVKKKQRKKLALAVAGAGAMALAATTMLSRSSSTCRGFGATQGEMTVTDPDTTTTMTGQMIVQPPPTPTPPPPPNNEWTMGDVAEPPTPHVMGTAAPIPPPPPPPPPVRMGRRAR